MRKNMLKKIGRYGLLSLTVLGTTLAAAGCSGGATAEDDNTLIIFNYGDYIERETIQMFEEETGIEVKYEEYITPEDMYTKYQSGAIDYDLICTSDYMIEKMIEAGDAQPIDTSKMEYLDNWTRNIWISAKPLIRATSMLFRTSLERWAFYITRKWWMRK